MTAIHINKVRHIENVDILFNKDGNIINKKHLILTGKNGSGKTSLLKALVSHLEYVVSNSYTPLEKCKENVAFWEKSVSECKSDTDMDILNRQKKEKNLEYSKKQLEVWQTGAIADLTSALSLREKYSRGEYILAYFGDDRNFEVIKSKNIEKIELKPVYDIKTSPSKEFSKYLVNLKTKQSFAKTEGLNDKANEIKKWFDDFENILRILYDEPSLSLSFDIDSFEFSIVIDAREPFDFNTMSKGYSAVFDIICDLILRTETKNNRGLEGIVLIDEIETHLHVELQKKIMPILTNLFPNIQFIITTHSPFILNSLKNAVIYDMEKQKTFYDNFTQLPYSGIVEGFFDTKELSDELQKKFERYKELINKAEKTVDEKIEIKELELYLDEIPDFLALDIATEYLRLKLESI